MWLIIAVFMVVVCLALAVEIAQARRCQQDGHQWEWNDEQDANRCVRCGYWRLDD